ncbi:serine/threonine-protein kinase [Streptomyces sp. NPDC089915]|uniref:serine/threonine-protein kinase n=1 Tax=Streptomyces sp. NPDC089915 TaxID=3155186 RepID=UPI0034461E08
MDVDVDADADVEAGGILLTEFMVERPLGSGGFAGVVLVRSRRTGERYAVKRLHSADPAHQGRLLNEVRRWVDLPAHPHIAPCRFARSIGDEVAVFSEYAPGGSLADRLRSGALHEGGERAALRRVLTAAVQSAWGLAAAHGHGLLHLDVKPANLLLDDDGTVRLTDFGLAADPGWGDEPRLELEAVVRYIADVPGAGEEERERLRAVLRRQLHPPRPRSQTSLQVSGAAAGTPAYASPEQAEGRRVGIPADVWSWAVTVLELFVGERTWPAGTVAGLVLRAARSQPLTPASLRIPPPMADLLERCFRVEPAQRPHPFGEIAEEVLRIADEETGFPLGLTPPPSAPAPAADRGAFLYERRAPETGAWSDPRGLLHYAYRTAGLDERDAVDFWPPDTGGPHAQLLGDLRTLREARRVLDSLPGRERDRPERAYARVRCLAETARVLEALGDTDGALAHHRTAAGLGDRLSGADAALLAAVLNSMCGLQRRTGDLPAALGTAERAVTLARRLPDGGAGTVLGSALLRQANVLGDMSRREAGPPAEALAARAATLYEASAEEFAATDDPLDVVPSLTNLAALERTRGNRRRAAELWREAEALLDRRISRAPADRYARELKAATAVQRAQAGETEQAGTAVELLTAMVSDEGVYQLSGRLGEALILRGRAEEEAGRVRAARDSYAEAVRRLEQAVLLAGDITAANRLARADDSLAQLIGVLEDPVRGLEHARTSLGRWRLLTEADGAAAWGGNLVHALTKAAHIALDADAPEEAGRDLDEALEILGSPGYAGTAPVPDSEAASVHRCRAVWLRRTGRPREALEACGHALDHLGTGPAATDTATDPALNPATAGVYVLTLETLSAAYADLDDHGRSLHAQEAAYAALVRSPGTRAPSAELAQSLQALAGARMLYGLQAEAAEAARGALDQYTELIPEGRSDLAAEAARVTGVLATSLINTGDAEGAERALARLLSQYGRLSTDDPALGRAGRFAARWLPDSPEPAHRRGGDVHAFMSEAFGNQHRELRGLLAVTPADLPARLADLGAAVNRASRAGAQGERRVASMLLEEIVGKLAWLKGRHPGADVEYLYGEAALRLGTFAMGCGRDAAAASGFARGTAAYRTLVVTYGRRELVDRYLRALSAPVMLHALRKDEAALQGALRELHDQARRHDPRNATAWLERARASVTDLPTGDA